MQIKRIKICPVCGIEYEASGNRMQIYCSPECKTKKNSQKRTERAKTKRQQAKAQTSIEKSQAEYRNHIRNYAEEQKAKTIAMIWGNVDGK